jgi:SAM-dependent methyltransferase
MIMQDLTPLPVRLANAFPGFKRRFKRLFYDAFSRQLQRFGAVGIRLLNYGYAYADGQGAPFELEGKDREEYPYSWNLVYETVRLGRVAGKKILVVGCGRGGDAHFIHRYLNAAAVVGVDVSRAGIEACLRAYPEPGLEFRAGDAERLDFPNGSFDAVVNIESSHCYADLNRFYREVRRCWRPPPPAWDVAGVVRPSRLNDVPVV